MICEAGHPIPEDARHCSICGAPPVTYIPSPAPAATAQPGMAIAALVLGISSVLGSLFVIGLPIAIAAIVLGAIAWSRSTGSEVSGKGMAIAGLALGVIGVFGTIFIIIALVVLTLMGFDVSNLPQPGLTSGRT